MITSLAPRSASRRRAFTLIEFLLASSLTILVVTLATQAVVSTRTTLKTTITTNTATRMASNVLDQARSFRCGEQTTPAEATAASPCSFGTAGAVGDVTFTRSSNGMASQSVDASVTLSTQWMPRQYGASRDQVCSPDTTGTSWLRPALLVRSVTIDTGDGSPRTFRVIAAAPTSATSATGSLGAIAATLTSARVGDRVTIHDTSSGNERVLTRIVPTSCAGGRAVVVFPYLPVGQYSISVSNGLTRGAQSTPYTVAADQITRPTEFGVTQ